MSLRGFLGALIGGSIGALQFFWLLTLDMERPESKMPEGDFWFFIFGLTIVVELISLMAIGMDRIAPWVTRLLRDDFETYWILKERSQHYSRFVLAASLAVVARAIARAIDAGGISESAGLGLLFATLPFLIPKPKPFPTRRG